MSIDPRNITPEYFLYFRDITEYFIGEGRKIVERCGGKVFDVYLFDLNLHVNCCEITPSFEMHYIESIPGGTVTFPNSGAEDQDSPYNEDIDEALREANIYTEPVMYIHVFDIENTPARIQLFDNWGGRDEWHELLDDHDNDSQAARNELIDQIREDIHANCPYLDDDALEACGRVDSKRRGSWREKS